MQEYKRINITVQSNWN